MVCVRLARAHTGKHKILKFWGHFHGLYDYVMFNAHTPLTPVTPGSYVEPCGESAGMPPQMDDLIIVVPWKDEAALERALREHGDEIGGIIMEPINYNQGCIVADTEYMQFVRDQASAHDIVLIYDEVLSAFRTGPDCAQGTTVSLRMFAFWARRSPLALRSPSSLAKPKLWTRWDRLARWPRVGPSPAARRPS